MRPRSRVIGIWEASMRFRPSFAFIVSVAALLAVSGAASAQTKITIGKITRGIGLHIPSYISMDKGFFKEQGLDPRWGVRGGTARSPAGRSGNPEFVAMPSGR